MTDFIVSAILMGVVFLYGCVGEIITEKSGHLNLGIPGIMCMGCAGGCLGASLYMGTLDVSYLETNLMTKTWESMVTYCGASWLLLTLSCSLMTILFAGLGGLIYAFLTVSLKSNQNVTGLALTIFGTGFCQFVVDQYVNTAYFSQVKIAFRSGLPFASKLGWFGEIFLSHGFYVYFAIAIAIVASLILKKTRVGLNLRAVGENPSTADAAGINVNRYKYLAILIGSAIAGFGGCFYVLYKEGNFDTTATIEGFGWLSIALVIAVLWKPNFAILGSIIFGALSIMSMKIAGISFAGAEALKLLPYVVTIIVLIVTSVMGSKENQGPAALGASYFREER